MVPSPRLVRHDQQSVHATRKSTIEMKRDNQTTNTSDCPECHGRGWLPSGDGFDEPCRECGGNGVVYDETSEDWESNIEAQDTTQTN